MRVILKECRKILDPKILLVLCVFSILYFKMFLLAVDYPATFNYVDSPYDVPFARDLVSEFGPTVAISEWDKIENKNAELEKQFAALIQEEPIFTENGIYDRESLQKVRDELFDKNERTEKDNDLAEKIHYYELTKKESSKLVFEMQYLRNLNAFKDDSRQSMSLLPSGVVYALQDDMKYMMVLIMICSFALIIPYHVKERVSNVLQIAMTTNIGRKCYRKQMTAGILSCLLVGIVQMLAYTFVYMKNGLSFFWVCENWAFNYSDQIFDGISFGSYMAMYALFILLFTIISVVAMHWIGRIAINYIAGIAISIPVGAVMCMFYCSVLAHLFYRTVESYFAGWEIVAAMISTCIMLGLGILRIRVDTQKDM